MKRLLKNSLTITLILFLLASFFPQSANGQELNSSSTDIEITVSDKEQTFLSPPSDLTAEGAVVIEQNTGKVLFGKHEHLRLYPASTTKILTALLAVELGDLDEIIIVGEEIHLAPWDGSKAGLEENERISLRDLVYGLMIHSGNDAGNTIAVHLARKVSGKNLPTEEALEYFADMMNKRAKEAGALNSHFVNPHGYHDPDHYTTAYDLAMIGREALKNDFFREAAATTAMNNYYWSSGEPRFWRSKNKLLNEKDAEYYPWATGGKTGYTSAAGHCLVTFASKDGLDLVAVVLKTDYNMQWSETKNLLEYGFANYVYHVEVKEDEIIETLPVDNYASDDWGSLAVKVSSADWGDVFLKNEVNDITRKIVWDPDVLSEKSTQDMPRVQAPIARGQKLGELKVMLHGEELQSLPLVAVRDVKPKKILDILPGQPGEGKASGLKWAKLAGLILLALIGLRTLILLIYRRRRRHYTIFRMY